MSINAIREELTTQVLAVRAASAMPDLVIEFDNIETVDLGAQTDPFMCVRVKLVDGDQMNLGTNPGHRILGQLELSVAIKKGFGSAAALALLDMYYPHLHRKNFNGVRTKMAIPAAPHPHLGWMYYGVLIPLWSDQVT